MKPFTINYWLAFALVMLFASCEKVITLDLKTAEPLVVIEGYVSDQDEIQTVKISKTYSFTEPNKFNAVSGAQVVLMSGSTSVTFSEGMPGIYESVKFAGTPGEKYTLEVIIEGKTYTASSVMPQKVPIDMLTYKKLSFFGGEETFPVINYQDPSGIQNQYRTLLSVNKELEFNSADEDRFNDGNKVENILFYSVDDLQPGDEMEIEFQSIDRNVFKYFFALSQISGNGGPPTAPANPVSNFNNGALGIFSAYSTDRKTFVKQ
ncbi:MAG: DUF4249 domain-containing protein [Daejeonella sp.]